MNRIFALLLCLLLLCGCAAPTPAPTEAPSPTVTQTPTEPAVTEPEVPVPLISRTMDNGNAGGLLPFGDALLLFSSSDGSTLTKLDSKTLETITSVELDCHVFSDSPSVQVSEKGVTYYDDYRRELVFLDVNLNKVRTVPVPEESQDPPALTADRKTLYYLTDTALRALDLESGIDRLVKEMSFFSQSIMGLHCDDTIVQINTYDDNGDWAYIFLSTEDGRLLYELLDYTTVYTEGDRFFATAMDGTYEENLTGLRGGVVQMLHCPDSSANCNPVLAQNAIVSVTEQPNGSVVLDYYQLSDGTHPYSFALPENLFPWGITGRAGEDCIWFLTYDDESGKDIIHRWNLKATPVEDDTVYIGIRRTAENPDEFGLEKCARYAEEISARHGVKILTWLDASSVEPWDYNIIPEYQVVVIQEALDVLDTALTHFPAGLLADATAEMGNGILHIGLARALYGVADSGALDSASGIQFWDDNGNVHISLEIGYSMEQNLYHELYHVMESRIYSHSRAFDDWNDLNPRGFEYDYEYRVYEYHDEYHWIDGEDRAFVDFYCMTYPKEDRARLLEYAMTPDNESVFTPEIMQKKLHTLCTAIREAYGLEAATETFLWEQYLTEPIHANG